MYHCIANMRLQAILECFADDVIRSQNKSKLWTTIALSKFELEKRSKAQNVAQIRLAIRNSSFSFIYRSVNFGKYAISDCFFISLSFLSDVKSKVNYWINNLDWIRLVKFSRAAIPRFVHYHCLFLPVVVGLRCGVGAEWVVLARPPWVLWKTKDVWGVQSFLSQLLHAWYVCFVQAPGGAACVY